MAHIASSSASCAAARACAVVVPGAGVVVEVVQHPPGEPADVGQQRQQPGVQLAAGPGEQRGDQPLLGQHGVQHDLGAEGVLLPHAVLQYGLGMRGHGWVGAARPGRRGCHPGEVIGAEPVQQRGRAGSGGRCPEEGEDVTSFHLRCPPCQGLDQVIILLLAQRPRAPADHGPAAPRGLPRSPRPRWPAAPPGGPAMRRERTRPAPRRLPVRHRDRGGICGGHPFARAQLGDVTGGVPGPAGQFPHAGIARLHPARQLTAELAHPACPPRRCAPGPVNRSPGRLTPFTLRAAER